MNSKITTNSRLSTTEPKKQKPKLSKQLEQEQTHRNGDHIEGYQWGRGEWGRKVQGIRSVIAGTKQTSEVKNSMGNGKAKEHICTTYIHELRGVGNAGESGGAGQRGI